MGGKRGMSRMAVASGGAVALLMVSIGGTRPAHAEDDQHDGEKVVASADFESGSFNPSTQEHYHASITSPGADGSGHAVQVGLSYDSPEDRFPTGGNLPTKMTGVDRGMFNLKVPNVKPNTNYRLDVKLKGRNLRWGIFDTEAKPYYRGLVRGDGKGEYDAGINTSGDGSQWENFSTTIQTGPRTHELNAFCLTAGKDENGVPGWCDDFKVTEIGSADHIQDDPTPWTVPPADAGSFPITIPAVQKFEASGHGKWKTSSIRQVIVAKKDADQIYNEANLGAANLKEEGIADNVTISRGSIDDLKADTVFVELGDVNTPASLEPDRVEDAYSIDISEKGIRITAGGSPAALYGLQTLTQALKSQKASLGGFELPVGVVSDWSDMGIRALQVDAGRRYYSISWLKQQVKDLAYTRMNTLVLRVKDAQGLRVESSVFPELVDHLPDGGSWSIDEVKDLVRYAKRFHVTIIPEFDMPAHAEGIDKNVFADQKGYMLGGEAYNYSRADVRERLGRAAVEMGELFESPYVHVGADEFMGMKNHQEPVEWIREKTGSSEANCYDAYVAFINEMNEYVKASGRQSLIWNDMLNGKNKVVPLDKDITPVYWAKIYGALTAGQLASDGRNIIGSSSDLYHDLWPVMSDKDQTETSNGSVINRPLPEYLWDTYSNPFVFSGGWGKPQTIDDQYKTQVKGQFFPIWDDSHGWAPESVLTQTLMPRLRLFAQNVWNSPKPVESFAAFDPYLRFYGHAPFFGKEQVFTVPETSVNSGNVVDTPRDPGVDTGQSNGAVGSLPHGQSDPQSVEPKLSPKPHAQHPSQNDKTTPTAARAPRKIAMTGAPTGALAVSSGLCIFLAATLAVVRFKRSR